MHLQQYKGEKPSYEEDTLCDLPAGRGDDIRADQQWQRFEHKLDA
jgi:hypothetical protein